MQYNALPIQQLTLEAVSDESGAVKWPKCRLYNVSAGVVLLCTCPTPVCLILWGKVVKSSDGAKENWIIDVNTCIFTQVHFEFTDFYL